MSEDLDILRRAVEEPVAQMLLAEVGSPTHSNRLAQQIREWAGPDRPVAGFGFNANYDNASELWERCHAAVADWDEVNPGLLLVRDDSPTHVRISHSATDKPTSIGFWRAMNQLREKWDALPSQTVFLVTREQYYFLTTEADHFKRWIPLKLHLPGPEEESPRRLIATPARAADEALTASLLLDDLEDREAARQNWEAYHERLRQAKLRGESPQTLANRYYLPLMAAAITLQKLEEAANYDRMISQVGLSKSQHLRWLRLRSRLEEGQGHIAEAVATTEQRLQLSQELDRARAKKDGKQQQLNPSHNTLSAILELYLLHKRQKNFDEAERWIRQGLNIAPDQIAFLSNYALFLKDVRQDHDKAEEFYQRTLEADPKFANNLGNYANFLQTVRQDYDKAEEFYQRAFEADPKHVNNLGNYGGFLADVRQDYDKAEEFFRRAVEAAPQQAIALGNYAVFLENERQDYDKAEEFYRRALEADPQYATALGNYAIFLADVRQDYDRAQELYQRALEINPKNAKLLDSYARLLCLRRHNFAQAGIYFQRAVNAAPNETQYVINYAAFLLIQGQKDEGKAMLERAAALPNLSDAQHVAIAFHRYIHFPEEVPSPLKELKLVLKAGKRAKNWTFDLNIERAEQDKHPNVPLLKALASVITEDKDLKSLELFREWRMA
jgi:Tfp pilus assembly protein PilF